MESIEPSAVEDDAPWLLTEVTVERFKAAFNNKRRAIPLKAFNVIVGRNGSGKSTLLEAIQWLDVTIRRDAREACSRYFGSADLVNLRSATNVPYFRFRLCWGPEEGEQRWRYDVKIIDREGFPEIAEEELCTVDANKRPERFFISTRDEQRWVIPTGVSAWKKKLDPSAVVGAFPVFDPDRLALPRATVRANGAGGGQFAERFLERLAGFWDRAVFLRLSPHRLAQGATVRRPSSAPLLDEEGQSLPSLLSELSKGQRAELVENVQEVLQGIRGVSVSEAELGRDTRVHYKLLEQMPYQGRSGRKKFEIPAWMLSEGSRRIVAILALLVRRPRPTFLCIEEVENGLDPWTLKTLLRHLQSAADDGVQVVLTTHSPWLLDWVPMDSILHVRRIQGNSEYMQFAEEEDVLAFDPNVPAGTRYVHLEE